MVQLLGMAAVAGGGALLGAGFSSCLRRREAALSQLDAALKLLSVRMLRRLDTLGVALREAGEAAQGEAGGLLVRAAEGLTRTGDTVQAMEDALARLPRGSQLSALTDADRRALERLFFQLGGGYDAQAAALEVARADLAALHEQARDECRRNARLYQSLGILGGIAAALFLM